jgi:DNA-binding winged helix-turn-helix (wHTH) protein
LPRAFPRSVGERRAAGRNLGPEAGSPIALPRDGAHGPIWVRTDCKPFGLEELAARCRTLMRRSGIGLQERVCVGPLEVHLLLRQVTLRDQPVELSPREFALLCALLMPPGVVRTRQELLRMAWPPFSGGPRSVDTQVLTLRRKLEQAGLGEGGGIETMRQQGYRFSLDTLPDPTDMPPNVQISLAPALAGQADPPPLRY